MTEPPPPESLAFTIPLHDHIGLTVRTLGPPAVLEVPLTDEIRGAVAPVHGGILATLADVACAAATSSITWRVVSTSSSPALKTLPAAASGRSIARSSACARFSV